MRAGAVVAVVSGAIGVFVVARGMSFAVHAISELGFTGATGALVIGLDPVLGIFGGSLLVGLVLGLLSLRGRERDSAIGAVLAFGLGLGYLFFSLYQAYATEALNLLFGNILGVSDTQLRNLAIVGAVVLLGLALLYRPLFFSSVDPEIAAELARRCEGLGYASVWSNDHPMSSGLETVAYFHEAAPKLQVGVAVLALDRHDPESIAAFLFVLADGILVRRLSEPEFDIEPLMDKGVAAARALLS